MASSKSCFQILKYYLQLFYTLLLISSDFSTGEIDTTIARCCSLGSSMAARDQHCNGISVSTPVKDVQPESQGICLSTMQLCCVHDLRSIECEDGKKAARSGRNCPDERNDRKYCCEACKLGILSASMLLGCEHQEDNLGCTWNLAYISCCDNNMLKSDQNLTQHQPVPEGEGEGKGERRGMRRDENICDLYPGELCAHICLPSLDSYNCICYEGFTLMADGKSCVQNALQDRCALSNPCQHKCYDTGMSIECSCHSGYQLHANNKSCIDVDECSVGQHYCREDETCNNEIGTFSCQKTKDIDIVASHPDINSTTLAPSTNQQLNCPLGFVFSAQEHQCLDVNECAENGHVCKRDSETCVNMHGGYRCVPKQQEHLKKQQSAKCSTGLKWNNDLSGCVDINECEEVNGDTPCDSNQICENTAGSYKCLCKRGYQLDSLTQACIDINECQVDLHNCLPSQRCDNTIGSFQCVRYTNCGTGYTLNAQSGQCEDDDECLLKIDNCRYLGPEFQCRNTLGSFRCERKGRESNGTCNGKCSSASLSAPSAPAAPCGPGLVPTSSGTCVDINECEKSLAKCEPNQRCINTHGSYICTNLLNCEAGFRLSKDKNRCIDIDECSEQTRICDHTCVNLWGSYRCSCQAGYKLHSDNRTCIDLNECELYKDRRLCTGYCVNQPGSYSCQCPNGYLLGSDGASCQDIDECKTGNACNGPDEVCLNMRGSYRCNSVACPAGYVKDEPLKNRCRRQTTTCVDYDVECKEQPMLISFYFITLVSNYTVPQTGLTLFTMRGPAWPSTTIAFEHDLQQAHTPPGVPAATASAFRLLRAGHNEARISLIQPLAGPQDIQLQVTMTFYYDGSYGGKTVSKIGVFVSPYEF